MWSSYFLESPREWYSLADSGYSQKLDIDQLKWYVSFISAEFDLFIALHQPLSNESLRASDWWIFTHWSHFHLLITRVPSHEGNRPHPSPLKTENQRFSKRRTWTKTGNTINQTTRHKEVRVSHLVTNIFTSSNMSYFIKTHSPIWGFYSLKRLLYFAFPLLNSRINSALGKCPISKKNGDYTDINLSDYKRDDPLGITITSLFHKCEALKRTTEKIKREHNFEERYLNPSLQKANDMCHFYLIAWSKNT